MWSSVLNNEESVNEGIAKQIRRAGALALENKYYKLESMDTDVFYLKHIVQYIPLVTEENYIGFQYWLHALLSSPFPVTRIIDVQAIENLAGFLISCSDIDVKLSKIAAKNLAVLAKNMYLENAEIIYSYEEHTICGRRVSPVFFFRFLKQLAIVGTVQGISIKITQKDSTVVKRYKLKIISYQTQKGMYEPQEALCIYRRFLNENDTKLGWTLSKCIYRVIRCVEKQPVLESLVSGLDKIFANEQLWINVATLLAFCALDKTNPGDVKKHVIKMLFYNNKYVHKSASVRETGLFLLWSMIRSGMHIDCLDSIILVALFDTSAQCRRAASTVLLEYVGRNHVDVGCKLLDIINFSSVKRASSIIPECISIARIIPSLKASIVEELKASMGHYNKERRTLGPRCLPHLERACPCVFSVQSSLAFHYSLFMYTLEFLMMSEPCKVCLSNGNAVFGYTIDRHLLKNEHASDVVDGYLSLAEDHTLMMDPKKLEENLLCLVDRNIESDKLTGVAGKAMSRSAEFAEKMFQGLAKRSNRAYILANALNAHFCNEVISKYKVILENASLDEKTAVIRAVRLSGKASLFLDKIREGLENYSVGFTGDISTYMRKECLLAAASLHDKLLFERYYMRFFVDRSKLLRDFLVAQGVRNSVTKENLLFLCIRQVDSGIHASIYESAGLREFMDAYYKEYDVLRGQSPWGHDKIHFSSAFHVCGSLRDALKKELFIGTVCAMKNSDASLFYFLLEKLYAMRERLHGCVIECLDVRDTDPGRTQLLALFFVFKVLMLENTYPDTDLETRLSITSGKMVDAEFIFSRSMCLHVSVSNIRKVARSASAVKLCEDALEYFHVAGQSCSPSNS